LRVVVCTVCSLFPIENSNSQPVSFYFAGSNKIPSTAFCLLLRLLTLRCTEKQMTLLLQHPDSPYIRAIGFLYLRFAGDPETVWKWIEPYLYDQERLQVQANASKQSQSESTIGDFVRFLFSSREYYGTLLPRLPIRIEREIQVKLLQAEKIEARAKKNAANTQRMKYFQSLGSKVMALYGDEENPVQWYEGVVDRVITRDEETSQPLRNPKFLVTFPEYGNTEVVSLGEMEMIGSTLDDVSQGRGKAGHREEDRAYSHNDGRRGGDRGYNDRDGWERGQRPYGGRSQQESSARALPSEHDLYEEVRRRERETVTVSGGGGRNAVAGRPPRTSTKHSLTATTRETQRRSPSPPPPNRAAGQTEMSQPREASPPSRKRTPEELGAIQAKKRQLMAKYG
jgi:pre-mRNA-splicing factor 38B